MKSVKPDTPIPSAKEIAARLGLSSERQKLIFKLADRHGSGLPSSRGPAAGQRTERPEARRTSAKG